MPSFHTRTSTLTFALLLAAFGASTLPASAGETTARTRKAATGGMEAIRSVAEVVALDTRTRTITLKRDDGNTLAVIAGPSVKNLHQVRVGDFVVAEYGRAHAVSLQKNAATGDAADNDTGRPPPANGKSPVPAKGKTPATTPRVQTIVADIMAIDDKKGYATLKGTHSNVVDIVVKDRRLLAAVKIGDQVTLQYTEAVAVSIKPARTKR